MPDPDRPTAGEIVSVAIGRWAVAPAPAKIRTLLGSCVGVVLYDRKRRLGGVAHIVLPDSRGSTEHPGKFADTAIPALIAEIQKWPGGDGSLRLTAKLAGGARMFQSTQAMTIGDQNQAAVERILAEFRITVLARDLGGETGRRLTLDAETGRVAVKIPGGNDYEI
jgi:chemotaxis protein CheD